jgi:hypothetical protein
MRSTKWFSVLLVVSVIALGCSDYYQPLAPEADLAVLAYGAGRGPAPQPVSVTVPFKGDFSVWNESDYSDDRCGGYPVFFLTMVGHGNATHLGKMGVRMTFCCNFATGAYWDTEATFVAANGDELWLTIPQGQILPNFGDNADYYQTRFDDPMPIVGGTGRFQGATGYMTTNAWVHNNLPTEWRTDFFPKGTLTMVQGKK